MKVFHRPAVVPSVNVIELDEVAEVSPVRDPFDPDDRVGRVQRHTNTEVPKNLNVALGRRRDAHSWIDFPRFGCAFMGHGDLRETVNRNVARMVCRDVEEMIRVSR
ncbi:MAG: hypothetical protein HY791_10020 [Deltaproteobacteria bacterium]|nr:hypothetical protein [Deltaproteobacteria bacterium]